MTHLFFNKRSLRLAALSPFLGVSLLCCVTVQAADYRVETPAAYKTALKKSAPGDNIILANGTWIDFEILFKADGVEGLPITLMAETKGQVILSGQSNLRLAGSHLVVSGLVFQDGYSPTQDVIAFRQNKENLAYHSRVTETVIIDYNKPERYENDFWVMMYGQHNRFDHNHISGKSNKGVTMAVRLDSEESQNNYHRIDHNYFGPRPILGSNGGETLRIGTSKYSLSDSYTTVENNYFDRCDGELEIISNKSGRNTFRNNTFFESRGTLTMRHGNNNLVEGNVFFGNGVDHTGGIRVINAGQTIRNNYLEGLSGTRFGGALVVMNGVPNSSINRYHQVKDALIVNNTLINSDNIQLAAGSDEERSATPVDSRFENNLIYNADGRDVFTVYDDISGIAFNGNVTIKTKLPQFTKGFTEVSDNFTRAENGLLYPDNYINIGVSRDLVVTTKAMTGTSWFPKPDPDIAFGSGKTIPIEPGESVLVKALSAAKAGDTIILSGGNYTVSRTLKIDKPLTFMSRSDAYLTFEGSALFEIKDGGSLRIDGLNISGSEAPDNVGNSVIRTSPYSMLKNYRLEIENSHIADMDINKSFNVVSVSKGTFADNIAIKDSVFRNITGSVLNLDTENDDYGIYNAEYLSIVGSTFADIKGAVVNFYRGGRDESTFGPHFNMEKSILINVGQGSNNKTESSLLLHGVQLSNVQGNTITNSAPIIITHTVGEPKTKIIQNIFSNTPAPRVTELNSGLPPTAEIFNNEGLEP